MADNYQNYSALKDSGVKWLGQVPAHWGLISGKWLFPERNTKAIKSDKQLTASQKHGVICQEDFMALEGQKVVQVFKGSDILKHVESNDFVISMRSFQGGIEYCAFRGCVSSAYVPIVPKSKVCINFFRYLLKCEPYIQGLQSTTNLVRDGQALRYSNFTQVLLPDIPLKEQEKIAQFLDFEIPQIDTLIDKQQQLIKLLKEKRQAVISHAVTKGLNPDAPMKNSGVEWLGEVPEHWVVAKLSFRYEVLLGKMLDDKQITGAYLGKYLRNTDVQWDRINTEDLPEMDFRPEEQERFSVKKGDLIVCEGGEIGRSAIWEKTESCFYQKALHRLRPVNSKNDNTRFMFYVLYDAVHQERFLSGAGKATIAHLPAETFKKIRFGFPPLQEQLLIAKYLDENKAKFDLLEEKANSQISLLQERRTALISAAVTGKIDVRNWQPAQTEIPLEASA